MSRLLRAINFSLNSKPSLFLRIKEGLDSLWFDVILDLLKYYEIKNFFGNLSWMLKAAWDFKPWDYTYNITLFAKSLEITGKTMINYGHGENNLIQGRRAIWAGKQLLRAYDYSEFSDASFRYVWSKLDYSFTNGLKRTYNGDPSMLEKMERHIHKRILKTQKQMKKEAWEYIHKYIETWWD